MDIQTDKSHVLRLGIIGLTHGHVHWIFNSEKRGDIKIVAITEPDRDLAQGYANQYGFDMSMVFSDIESMLDQYSPQAVAAFGSIYQHLEVVQAAAPRGIHVMVEKPLAVNIEHARQMHALALKHHIHLLTNYETSWYSTNHKAKEILENGLIGSLRKAIICDGHNGPVKRGVNAAFLNWLTDEMQNGGGAIIDFGCYGANLMSWLMQGEKPLTVTAITQQFQPEHYSNVDDESVIMLSYKNANAIIMGSWNWPIPRKDMELFGSIGKINARDKENIDITYLNNEQIIEESLKLPIPNAPFDDPFSYFAMLIKEKISIQPYDLSSIENNMLVVEILDAARESAKTGKTIYL